jgi:hypothetical protein
MILVVIGGMSVAFAYFTGYVKDFQIGRGSSIMELICMEDVWFQDEQTIRIAIYNYGKVDVKIVSLYMDNILVAFQAEDGSENFIEIPVKGHRVITVEHALTENTRYRFKLVTNRGSIFEEQHISPSVW